MKFEPLFHLYYGDEFLFPERVAATSGIMVGKYPETPGKLSTLSTMLYKQIVYNFDKFPGVSGYFPTIIPEVAATLSGNKNSSP